MRTPIGSAAFGAALVAGIALLGTPTAHAATPVRPVAVVDVDLCVAANLNLSTVTTDLDNALSRLDGVTATADELTRRLGLGTLLGTDETANQTAITRIRDVLTLRAAKVLAQDRVDSDCADDTVVVVPSTTPSSSATANPRPHWRQTHRVPKRAPETGGGPVEQAYTETGFDTDRSIAPAMALYALLSVGTVTAIRVGGLWLRGR